jgi:hypothetical protein
MKEHMEFSKVNVTSAARPVLPQQDQPEFKKYEAEVKQWAGKDQSKIALVDQLLNAHGDDCNELSIHLADITEFPPIPSNIINLTVEGARKLVTWPKNLSQLVSLTMTNCDLLPVLTGDYPKLTEFTYSKCPCLTTMLVKMPNLEKWTICSNSQVRQFSGKLLDESGKLQKFYADLPEVYLNFVKNQFYSVTNQVQNMPSAKEQVQNQLDLINHTRWSCSFSDLKAMKECFLKMRDTEEAKNDPAFAKKQLYLLDQMEKDIDFRHACLDITDPIAFDGYINVFAMYVKFQEISLEHHWKKPEMADLLIVKDRLYKESIETWIQSAPTSRESGERNQIGERLILANLMGLKAYKLCDNWVTELPPFPYRVTSLWIDRCNGITGINKLIPHVVEMEVSSCPQLREIIQRGDLQRNGRGDC